MTVNHITSAKQRFSTAMSTCSILSAILVVWIHAYNAHVYNDSYRATYWIQEVISQGVARGAVPFFLMSSAYFLYSKDKKVLDVYQTRGKSVLLPYLLWNSVYMIAFAVLRYFSLTNTGMDAITVENVLGGLFLHKYNYAYWFMRDLVVLIALYPLIRWVLGRGKVMAVAVWGLLWIGIFFEVTFFKSVMCYFLGAMIGYYYGDQAERVVEMDKKKQWLIIGVLFAVSAFLFGIWYSCEWWWLAVLRDLLIALLMFFVVVRCNVRIGGVFAGLSFMIYSIHPLLLEMIEKMIYMYFPHNDLWAIIDYTAAPVICIALIVVICFVWKKILPKMYKVFNGGRL